MRRSLNGGLRIVPVLKSASAKPQSRNAGYACGCKRWKDCGARWKEEKVNTGAKGGTAYRKFMSECLKKVPA